MEPHKETAKLPDRGAGTSASVRFMQDVIRTLEKNFETPDLHAPTLIAFLDLGQRDITPMKRVAGVCQLPQPAISRIVGRLGEGTSRVEGLGLVEAYIDPCNRRRKLVRLTDKGQQVYRELAEVMA